MYELVSFVTRSKIRKRLLKELLKPKTPTQISNNIGIFRSAVSRAILDLEKKKLIKCLTPNEKMGRFYETTELGKKVLDKIENICGD